LNLNIDLKQNLKDSILIPNAVKPDLVSDYAKSIDSYLKQLQQKHQVSGNFLESHKVSGVYRAKMVDWMVEVLTAFKCADQTFFIAVSLMDRYFNALAAQGQSLELSELHLVGVVCMFMASKYEDVYPLLMKTVFNKIGHAKISVDAIRAKEMDILRAIGF
jgi:Cyclin, N-terminal domain